MRTISTVLTGTLNNDSVAGPLGLISAYLSFSHSLQRVRPWSAVDVLSAGEMFVTTTLRYDGIANNRFITNVLVSVPLKSYEN